MEEIEEKVRAMVANKLGVDLAKVTMDANFSQDLQADSLDTVELIMDLEQEFGVKIPEEETQNIATVGDAVAYIKKSIA
ncbi:MAG: acyl carrier protein [Paludibacteraceae bacterium]|nr:acyl carrier protein [Paludibacteraceae bacterium]